MRHIRYLDVSEYQTPFGHFTIIPGYIRRFPKTTEEFRRLPKNSEDCLRRPKTTDDVQATTDDFRGEIWKFSKQIRNKKSSKHLTALSRETVKIKNLANLTENTKNYGQIKLNSKPHSDPLVRQFQLFQKISEDCWGFAKTTEDFQEQPTISEGKSGIFFKRKKQKQMTNKLKNEKPSKQLTVFFSATVNIIKLDNLTANSKN